MVTAIRQGKQYTATFEFETDNCPFGSDADL